MFRCISLVVLKAHDAWLELLTHVSQTARGMLKVTSAVAALAVAAMTLYWLIVLFIATPHRMKDF